MLKSRFAIFLIVGALLASTARAQKMTAQDIYKTFAGYVVTIKSDKGTGTGFIDSNFRIFTCYHVVEGSSKVTVRLRDGTEYLASGLSALDRQRDVAVLELDIFANEIKSSETRRKMGKDLVLQFGDFAGTNVGEKVVVLGSPLGLDGSITEGLISAKRQIEGIDHIQLSASVSPGSSGSPVFNNTGKVIGMVTSKNTRGESINFAVGANELKSVNRVSLADLKSKSIVLQAAQNIEDSDKDLLGILAASVSAEKYDKNTTVDLAKSVFEESWTKVCKELKIRVLSEADQEKYLNDEDSDDLELFVKQDGARSRFDFTYQVSDLPGDKVLVAIRLTVYRGALLFPYSFHYFTAHFDFEKMEISKGGDVGKAAREGVAAILKRFKTQFEKEYKGDG
jgi:hypothetical protein